MLKLTTVKTRSYLTFLAMLHGYDSENAMKRDRGNCSDSGYSIPDEFLIPKEKFEKVGDLEIERYQEIDRVTVVITKRYSITDYDSIHYQATLIISSVKKNVYAI